MSTQIAFTSIPSVSVATNQDLRQKQYHAVKISGGWLQLATTGDAIFGILQNAPNVGGQARIMAQGFSQARLGGTVSENDLLSIDSNGQFISGTGFIKALESGTAGQLIDVLVSGVGGTEPGAPSNPLDDGSPENITITGHGFASITEPLFAVRDVESSSPTENQIILSTTALQGAGVLNDPSLREFEGYIVGRVDADTLSMIPVDNVWAMGKQTFSSASFTPGTRYWMGNDGNKSTTPGTHAVRLFRASSATEIYYYPDVRFFVPGVSGTTDTRESWKSARFDQLATISAGVQVNINSSTSGLLTLLGGGYTNHSALADYGNQWRIQANGYYLAEDSFTVISSGVIQLQDEIAYPPAGANWLIESKVVESF